MMLGQRIDELAHDVLYIHPALPEVLEQGLLELASRGPEATRETAHASDADLSAEFNLTPPPVTGADRLLVGCGPRRPRFAVSGVCT
jgi:hypothetical protein